MRFRSSKKEKVYNFLLEVAQEIAKRKLGGLFVVAPKNDFKKVYEPLYPQLVSRQKIFEKGSKELLVKLAELDGAFLVGDDGTLVAFGARIKKSRALPGYGTKHAAAAGITSHLGRAQAILVSEETSWVKVFRDGKVVLEMDPEKTSASTMNKVVSFITDNDTTLLATAGVSAAIMGIMPVVVVSGTYLALKTASGVIRKGWK